VAEDKNPLFGKTWTNHSVHSTHAAAHELKETLESDELQVKIRRTADETFRVKTRSTVVAKAKSVKNDKEKPKTRAGRRSERDRRKKRQNS